MKWLKLERYYRKIIERKMMTMFMKKYLFLCIVLIGIMGCSIKPDTNLEENLICNETSNGKMAELENGFFLVFNNFLYYADKDNLEKWSVVCNKPECMHTDDTCNGSLQTSTTIWQKDGELYEMKFGRFSEDSQIFNIATDGSGIKNVYSLPIEKNVNGGGKATFQDQFIVRYNYLNEQGLQEEKIISLQDEDGKVNINTLYEGTVENASLFLSGNTYWGIRGDDVVITSLYLNEDKVASENICKINNNKIEPLNLPNDINLMHGYVSEDTFLYYQQNEGFYKYYINTGERELILKNQLDDACGYILSEKYIIECNYYSDFNENYIPEKAYLKVYNGEKWIDLDVPTEVANSDTSFYPTCIASDRIFFICNGNNVSYLYYMMFDEENPKLTFAGKIGDGTLENINSEESSSGQESETDVFENFKEEVIFDNDDYLLKVTDIYLDYANRCCIEMYLENRSNDKLLHALTTYCAINGIQCNIEWGIDASAGTSCLETLCLTKDYTDPSKLSDFYSADEYSDIEIGFGIQEGEVYIPIEENTIHLYPQGKENSVTFTHEPESTDLILIDNEKISVIITGYEQQFVPNDTINVLIENKTDSYMKVKVEEASANDITIEPVLGYGVYYTYISPKAVCMYPMTLFDGVTPEGPFQPKPKSTFFDTNHITNIEKIEMKLRIMEYKNKNMMGGVEDIIYENYILIP